MALFALMYLAALGGEAFGSFVNNQPMKLSRPLIAVGIVALLGWQIDLL